MAFKESKEELKNKIRRSLIYSVWDGIFYSIMAGFGESFLIPFAVFLGATDMYIALLSTLPQFIGSIFQVVSIRVMKIFPSRKFFVASGAFLQGVMMLIIASLFFIKYNIMTLLFLGVILYFIFAMMISPAWSSWMGDLVDKDKRGKYFGKRNLITGTFLFGAFIIAGYVLQQFGGSHSQQFLGFFVLFVISFAGRMFSTLFITKQYEPKYTAKKEENFSFMKFIKQLNSGNFGILVLYLCLMNFAVTISGPFFTPYMLKDLKMSYFTFTLVNSVALIVKYFLMPVWGRYADRYGSKTALVVSGVLLPIIPIIWVFSKSTLWIVVVQTFSAFAWAGFELVSSNFMFDATNKNNRVRSFAYYNALSGTLALIAGILGGFIVRYNHFFWSIYITVFLVSGLLRALVSIILLPKLKEVRRVEHISYKSFLFGLLSFKTFTQIGHTLMSLDSYLIYRKDQGKRKAPKTRR